jgi:hypothetical protein
MMDSKGIACGDESKDSSFDALLRVSSWECCSSNSLLDILVNFSPIGLVPIGLKFIKRFRKGVWGITLLQKGFPQ